MKPRPQPGKWLSWAALGLLAALLAACAAYVIELARLLDILR